MDLSLSVLTMQVETLVKLVSSNTAGSSRSLLKSSSTLFLCLGTLEVREMSLAALRLRRFDMMELLLLWLLLLLMLLLQLLLLLASSFRSER